MKKFFQRLFRKRRKKNNPCRFSKKMVVLCISFIIFYTLLQSYLNYVHAIEVSPTLTTCVYAFFGTELISTAFIKICDKEVEDNEKKSISKDDDNAVG